MTNQVCKRTAKFVIGPFSFVIVCGETILLRPTIHERILQYLAESGKAHSAGQILREVLKLDCPNRLAAHQVLKGILAKDRRFRHTRAGLWSVPRRGSFEHITGLDSAAVLFLEGT